MATNTVLQWQSHVTDSTDRETILGNLDFLENFAGAIMGDESLHNNFAEIRKGINNGTLKPTDWKTSTDFQNIITKLTNASSVKVKDIDGRLKTAEGSVKSHGEALSKKLDSSTFDSFKTDDFKTITDWKSKMEKEVESFALSTELENVKTLLNNEVSHWTAETAPDPQVYTAASQVKASKQPWGTGEDPARHVNDLCTVIGEKATDKGVSYRFVKDPNPNANSYKWLKVIDNDGALALSKFTKFKQVYDQRQNALDSDSKAKQKSIDDMAQKVKDQSTEIDDQRKKLDSSYKVTVTTRGTIRNGEIVDGTTSGGTPAILYTAHVYDIVGNKVTDKAITDKLTWTINKGRTTTPKERTFTGTTCYVTAENFVKDGTNPNYYDIELRSTF